RHVFSRLVRVGSGRSFDSVRAGHSASVGPCRMPQNDDSGKGLRPLLHCRLDQQGALSMQNGHPLVVHFPVAFLTIATIAAIVGAIVRWRWIEPFARTCLYLGT